MRCTVLGAGSWGTALAIQLARVGHDTLLWDRNPDRCAHMNAERTNPRYLKGEILPEGLHAEPDLERAMAHAELLVPVLPSHGLREVIGAGKHALSQQVQVCCATKGIEGGTLQLSLIHI